MSPATIYSLRNSLRPFPLSSRQRCKQQRLCNRALYTQSDVLSRCRDKSLRGCAARLNFTLNLPLPRSSRTPTTRDPAMVYIYIGRFYTLEDCRSVTGATCYMWYESFWLKMVNIQYWVIQGWCEIKVRVAGFGSKSWWSFGWV